MPIAFRCHFPRKRESSNRTRHLFSEGRGVLGPRLRADDNIVRPMHDIRWIREHKDKFDRGLARRGLAPLAAELIALDERRRIAISALEAAQARRNAASKEIGQAKARKDDARAQELMAEVAALKERVPGLEAEEKD